jgi:hypothetical protein
MEKLKEKSTFVKWNKIDRVEHFSLIAKKIEGKDVLREKGFFVFDLEDLHL